MPSIDTTSQTDAAVSANVAKWVAAGRPRDRYILRLAQDLLIEEEVAAGLSRRDAVSKVIHVPVRERLEALERKAAPVSSAAAPREPEPTSDKVPNPAILRPVTSQGTSVPARSVAELQVEVFESLVAAEVATGLTRAQGYRKVIEARPAAHDAYVEALGGLPRKPRADGRPRPAAGHEFEQLVSRAMRDGASRGEATRAMVRAHPDVHDSYVRALAA